MAEQKNTTRVSVPEVVGAEVIVRWDGDDPTTYPVRSGFVEVENDRVERFLSYVEGSSADDGNPVVSKTQGGSGNAVES